MALPLTPAQQELLLLHILMTTSTATYSPASVRFATGTDILNQIAKDFNAVGMPFGKSLTWANITLPVATDTANRAKLQAAAFDKVSTQVFEPTATLGSLWGGPQHPPISDVMYMLDMIP